MEFGHILLVLVLGISVISLGFAGYLAKFVLGHDMGTSAMQEISDAIKEGAEAFLKRQYSTIIMLSLALAVLIFVMYWLGKGDMDLAWRTTVAFLFGAGCSALAGYIGMYISIRSIFLLFSKFFWSTHLIFLLLVRYLLSTNRDGYYQST